MFCNPLTLLFNRTPSGDADALAFSPSLLRLTDAPPNPLRRKVLWLLLALLAALLVWALIGRLDIVAVAEGKLIPQSYVKIVQPAESGIVKDILMHEGDSVHAGQVLMRMDTLITDADVKSVEADCPRNRPWRASRRPGPARDSAARFPATWH